MLGESCVASRWPGRESAPPLDREELKVPQRVWVHFRDAEAKYEAGLGARGGSLYPTIYEGRRAALTKARTAELKAELKGEG